MDSHRSQQSFACNALFILTYLAISFANLFGAPPCLAEPQVLHEFHAVNAQGKDETFFDDSYSKGDGFASVSTINTLSSVSSPDFRLLHIITGCADLVTIVTIFWGLVLLIDALQQWNLRTRSHVHFLRGGIVTGSGVVIPPIVQWVYATGCQLLSRSF